MIFFRLSHCLTIFLFIIYPFMIKRYFSFIPTPSKGVEPGVNKVTRILGNLFDLTTGTAFKVRGIRWRKLGFGSLPSSYPPVFISTLFPLSLVAASSVL